ncbi:MAG: hypothetical protein IJR50_02440 [Treponema sp.]|nr:hypothetical protein [Treponema sp.]
MKKLAALFTGIAVLVCGIVMTGCDNDSKNTIQEAFAPKNTWIEETVTVSGNNIYCYLYYNDSGSSISISNTHINSGKLDAGLTIIVRGTSGNSVFNSLTNNNIVVKTIKTGENVETEGGVRSFSADLWTALGIVRSFHTKTISTPECVRDTSYTVVTGEENEWKTFLANLLTTAVINKLLA